MALRSHCTVVYENMLIDKTQGNLVKNFTDLTTQSQHLEMFHIEGGGGTMNYRNMVQIKKYYRQEWKCCSVEL